MNVLILSATASATNYRKALRDREDLNLFFTDINPRSSGFYDDRITPLVIPRSRNYDAYRDALDRIIQEHSIDILIPTSDHDMQGIAYLRKHGWEPNVKMFDFDPDQLFLFVHKEKVMEKLSTLTNGIPKNYHSESEYKFPCVIKPIMEGGSKGVSIVETIDELREKEEELVALYGDEYVIQEFIPGDTGSIYVALLLYGDDGKLYGEALSHSTLTFMTWGGGGNAGKLVHNQEVLDQAKEIVNMLGGWKGPINLEFKQSDQSGEFYLMEINCRLNGYSYLTTMNGMNFPAAIIDLLTKGDTAFLKMPTPENSVNFIVNLREKPVDAWVGE